MKGWLTLLLGISGGALRAQSPAAGQPYADARMGYRLSYPGTWLVGEATAPVTATFYPGPADQRLASAEAILIVRPLPDSQKDQRLLAPERQDSVWRALRRLPQAQVLALYGRDAGSYQELRYDYIYTPQAAARTRVVGRRLWRGGYEYQLEYRAAVGAAGSRYLAEGQMLLASLELVGSGPPSRRYADQTCDDKMYGIAALRIRDGLWEDDCRTIHEFAADPAAPPKVHRRVLPFQSYALAKGFDNCLYSVTKAPTDSPTYVFRYDPTTRRGRYTSWQLPAQGGESFWISAATDDQGDLYFITSDGDKLVKVSPSDGRVTTVWTKDPLRQANFYSSIGFAGAGTHANFCIDNTDSLYQVYSTTGALLKIDMRTQRPAPRMLPVEGLPERGGYSDALLQQDADGPRRLFLAGPRSLYEVDLKQRQARRVRRGAYTDLAGCNLFRNAAPPTAPAPPTTATWHGRVLDAVTLKPLLQARLRLRGPGAGAAETFVALAPDGTFSYTTRPGVPVLAQVQLAGYLGSDSLYTLPPGPSAHDILLRPLAVGATLPLDNVQFEQGRPVLLTSSYAALNQLLTLLTSSPGLTIELRGHTDNVGDPQKNVELSEQRVEAVKAYLVAHGVAESRISGRGLGGTEPRASNDFEVTRRLNRRVEFRVTRVQ